MSNFKTQLAVEKTIAQKEVANAISKMVNKSATFIVSAMEVVTMIHNGLANCENPLIEYVVSRDTVLDVISTVISNGYGNLAPLQSVAARLVSSIDMDLEFKEKYHLAMELVSAVGQTSEYVRLVHTEGTYYVVSEYKHDAIDNAVYNAAHPMPLLVSPKAINGIDDNAYRSDSGYNVMLGTKLNHHDNPLPTEIINYLSRVPYSIEEVSHSVRPMKVPKSNKVNHKVKEQLEYNSKMHTNGTCKTMQYLFDNGNKFYFAHSFDKRIRVYSKGYQINLQGNEYDKSVLEFSKKLKLTAEGYEHLLIATANAYGLDKQSFTNRILWCYENMSDLEALTAGADEPLIYAKCVRAIRAHKRGEKVGIPTHFDATASGLQINGCLLACPDTLLATNAIANSDGKRMDVYTQVFDDMKVSLPMLKLSRSQVKDAAVPAIYGSEAEPKAVFGENVDHFWKAFEQMHGAYWYLKVLPQLWRDDITEYTFTTPDGFKVYVPVTGDVETEVFVECLGEDITITEEVIGRKEQSKCFLANITHSLDAYILRNIVRKCQANGIDIMCIHDSFGVHPNYAGQVAEWYRIELANLVKLDVLPNILKQIFGFDVVLPNYGCDRNDLAELILESQYALS